MRYFAIDNSYATPTSTGFSNTWRVLYFSSRDARDKFVSEDPNLGTKAILRKDIGKYLEMPKPFSGQAWVLRPDYTRDDGGQVCLGYSIDEERLNK